MKMPSHTLSTAVACGIAIMCAALVVGSAPTAQAGINVWTSHGPGTVPVAALAVDPSTPTTLYAGTYTTFLGGDGVFKSTDGGGSWNAANRGLPAGVSISALAIDPRVPSTLYAGTYGSGVFRSNDGARTWTAATAGLPNARVLTLAIDPTAPATLYALANDVVFKSTDGGTTWASTATLGTVLAFALDPTTGTLYVGTSGVRVFKSRDGGSTWSAASTGLPDFGYVLALAVDPTSPTTLYAGTETCFDGNCSNTGVFRSRDGGTTWSAASTGLPGPAVTALALDSGTPGTVYALTYNGTFKSTDGAGTWNVLAGVPADGGAVTLALDPSTPATLYAGTYTNGVLKSTDGGSTSSPANAGLPGAAAVPALAVDPETPGTVYAGTERGVFKSTDGAETWSPASTGLPTGAVVVALAIDPTAPSTLYAATGDITLFIGGTGYGVFKSTDGGATWTGANTGLPVDVPVAALAIDPKTPGTLYAGTYGRGLFKSTDGGTTWNGDSAIGPAVIALAIDPITPTTLYAAAIVPSGLTGCEGCDLGVSKSMDGGGSWSATGLTHGYVTVLAIDPLIPSTLYALGLKSADAAVSWMPMALPGVSALAIDPITPTTLYAGSPSCSEPSCVFKSTDEGGSWAPFNAGLPNTRVISLAADAAAPTTIYAGTLDSGVFVIEQVVPSCVGDCSGTSGVAINDLVTLVNVALGAAQPSACPHGVPNGAEVDVALLVQAVRNALLGC